MNTSELGVNLRIWAPLIISSVLILLGFTLHWGGDFHVQLNLGILAVDRDLPKTEMTRNVLLGLAAASFLYQSVRNYSKFFPTHLTMKTYFDNEGIARALRQFSTRQLRLLNVPHEWEQPRQLYLDQWNDVLESFGVRYFKLSPDVVGSGETTFRATKVKWFGQTYRVEESIGSLRLEGLPPFDNELLRIQFELLDTDASYLRASILDVYMPTGWTKVLQPRFAQWVQTGPTERFHVDNIIAMIKIRFFPIRTVGSTVYLAQWPLAREGTSSATPSGKQSTVAQYVPIGYTIYDSD